MSELLRATGLSKVYPKVSKSGDRIKVMMHLLLGRALPDSLMLPEVVRPWLAANPVSIYCTTTRDWLMFSNTTLTGQHALAVLIAGLSFGLGLWIFRKLARHFEDFL